MFFGCSQSRISPLQLRPSLVLTERRKTAPTTFNSVDKLCQFQQHVSIKLLLVLLNRFPSGLGTSLKGNLCNAFLLGLGLSGCGCYVRTSEKAKDVIHRRNTRQWLKRLFASFRLAQHFVICSEKIFSSSRGLVRWKYSVR